MRLKIPPLIGRLVQSVSVKPEIKLRKEGVDQLKFKQFVFNLNVEIIMSKNEANITGSTVGSFIQGTSGHIEGIKVSIGNLQQIGAGNVADAFDALVKSIQDHKEFSHDTQKEELLGQISYLSDQAAQPPEKRATSVIKPVLVGLSTALQGLGGLATAWQTWGSVLLAHFGLN
jgi:hypothetical protein